VPNLTDVKHSLNLAQEKVKNPPPQPFPWALTTIGVTLVSVGAYGSMWGKRCGRTASASRRPRSSASSARAQSGAARRADQDRFRDEPSEAPGSIRLEPEEAERAPVNFEPEQMIITYCTSPEEQQSARVAQTLRQRGFKTVRTLKGGLGGWTNARLPVEGKSALPSIGLELYKNLSLGDVERRRFRPGEVIFKEGDDPHDEAT